MLGAIHALVSKLYGMSKVNDILYQMRRFVKGSLAFKNDDDEVYGRSSLSSRSFVIHCISSFFVVCSPRLIEKCIYVYQYRMQYW